MIREVIGTIFLALITFGGTSLLFMVLALVAKHVMGEWKEFLDDRKEAIEEEAFSVSVPRSKRHKVVELYQKTKLGAGDYCRPRITTGLIMRSWLQEIFNVALADEIEKVKKERGDG